MTIPSANSALRLGMLSTIILVGGFGSWAYFARIEGAVIAPGLVVSNIERQAIQHPEGGTVGRLNVEEGSTVAAGAPILSLKAETLRTELAILENERVELLVRRARLDAELQDRAEFNLGENPPEDATSRIEAERALLTARAEAQRIQREQLKGQITQTTARVRGLDRQTNALEEQIRLIEGELAGKRALFESNLIEARVISQLERERARLDGQIGNIVAQRAEAQSQIAQVKIQLTGLDVTRREDLITQLRDLRFRELELAQQRVELERRLDELDLRAPFDGVIHDMQIAGAGAVIQAAQPLMYVVPRREELRITAEVRPEDIEDVRVGQRVRVQLTSFDLSQTPDLYGEVTLISADVFTVEATQRRYYEVEITLDEGALQGFPDSGAVILGVPVTTYMRTGERSPFAYLTDPLRRYFDQAMRG
ncbi:HlyD family type I secretion periplasmic adaptor subunit [Actibacterium sp. 188UL27-1]|uniref:HlyD family type I secretion periplasmic adaptor subunit n=1 Tax=Actibacterium sp. 188UL27-1 TaxID=2786961 RepID=UPI0019574A24|nr:HlyD family type I secretion periplasmic adaptor subunit [Actibacterium sp. 188UL27-1]MBM7070288.1 HlyD family type I secretion periplasmic adaptor subunit [Actibacterium sp. 188UL27-1]